MTTLPLPDLTEPSTYRVIARYDFAAGGFRIVIVSPFGDELYTSDDTTPNPRLALAVGRGLIGEFIKKLKGDQNDYLAMDRGYYRGNQYPTGYCELSSQSGH